VCADQADDKSLAGFRAASCEFGRAGGIGRNKRCTLLMSDLFLPISVSGVRLLMVETVCGAGTFPAGNRPPELAKIPAVKPGSKLIS
jgi:hypothetical protein